ncbi:hypothetical protein F3087_02820 [Nocardia colli]|uniref:Uncharacterized protein n=1 Tax=Nocardia colli TaxID=2545717 RepID=A0A5N0ELH8_9NOCA|nr:hypothetical protein [Nocardia colli]KAA8890258.1 hypothetical protein F3087_02820 [Nocardia colli]
MTHIRQKRHYLTLRPGTDGIHTKRCTREPNSWPTTDEPKHLPNRFRHMDDTLRSSETVDI